jgi:hypothetical protein
VILADEIDDESHVRRVETSDELAIMWMIRAEIGYRFAEVFDRSHDVFSSKLEQSFSFQIGSNMKG